MCGGGVAGGGGFDACGGAVVGKRQPAWQHSAALVRGASPGTDGSRHWLGGLVNQPVPLVKVHLAYAMQEAAMLTLPC